DVRHRVDGQTGEIPDAETTQREGQYQHQPAVRYGNANDTLKHDKSSVVVAGARFFDIRADEEALFGDVAGAGFQAAEHLDVVGIPPPEVEHAHLIGVSNLGVHHGEIPERLERARPDRE